MYCAMCIVRIVPRPQKCATILTMQRYGAFIIPIVPVCIYCGRLPLIRPLQKLKHNFVYKYYNILAFLYAIICSTLTISYADIVISRVDNCGSDRHPHTCGTLLPTPSYSLLKLHSLIINHCHWMYPRNMHILPERNEYNQYRLAS